MIISSNSPSRGSGILYQVGDALLHAMSGTELSRVRTELRLLLPKPINKSPVGSRGADIVMQSSRFLPKPHVRSSDLSGINSDPHPRPAGWPQNSLSSLVPN